MIAAVQWYLVCLCIALFPARLLVAPSQPPLARLSLALLLAAVLLLAADAIIYVVRRKSSS